MGIPEIRDEGVAATRLPFLEKKQLVVGVRPCVLDEMQNSFIIPLCNAPAQLSNLYFLLCPLLNRTSLKNKKTGFVVQATSGPQASPVVV